MKTSHKQLLVVGLPGTGKTTFLAALWHIVESAEIGCSLVLKELHGNREHLNKIRNDWLGCRKLDRTRLIDEQIVSMKLTRPDGKEIIEVFFPDMSGESFRLQWTDRRWQKSYHELVQKATGVLLFIHPDEIDEPIRMDEADKLVMELPESPDPDTHTTEEFAEWNPSHAPTQVKLVELLQFISACHLARPLRISVIVSAWDLISGSNQQPDEWVDDRLPLLSQYLTANSACLPYRIFGVSAQGGNYSSESSDRLSRFIVPSKRIIVVGSDCGSHDLTTPITWLMG
jgi:hypothetical protein